MTKVVHNKVEPYDVYIGRPSKWGNPYSDKHGTLNEFYVPTREEAISAYRGWIAGQTNLLADLHELRGKTLGCWCAPLPCHGDVLLELANPRCSECNGNLACDDPAERCDEAH